MMTTIRRVSRLQVERAEAQRQSRRKLATSILIIVDIALEIFMHKQCECEYERGKHINSYLSMK